MMNQTSTALAEPLNYTSDHKAVKTGDKIFQFSITV